MKFFHSLSFRVLGGSFILLLGLVSFYSYFAIRFYNDQIMNFVKASANRMSDVIKNSTHYSMLLNRKEDVYQIINTIGQEPGVEGIRIYNKRGEIIFSTSKSEEHTIVNMAAEACWACHEQKKPLQSLPINTRLRTYNSPKGYRVLGLINPIRNEASCSNNECHAHPSEKTVLGVLDVRLSLEQVDKDRNEAQATMIIFAAVLLVGIATTSVLFLIKMVYQPVHRLIIGTKEISSGNLNYRIPMTSKDELGELAKSFNAMTVSLQSVIDENQKWSDELEKRVLEKTDELKRIHQQIIQIEKMASLGKLSATVAHELNNPLEGILTYAKLILKRIQKMDQLTEPLKQSQEDLKIIITEIERCGNIVKNLLLFSRKQVGEFALVPLKHIIDRVTQLMQHHMQISNVQFHAAYESETISIMCDKNQIEQALVALIVNAVEAMPGGGSLWIEISTETTSKFTQIKLIDTGAGISPEDLPHVFEPFYTKKKEGQGVGLGLSVVYGIVERHDGKVEVTSELGKGTTFSLFFPPAHQRTKSQLHDSEHV